MYTGVYWPEDPILAAVTGENKSVFWWSDDNTAVWNRNSDVEGPSYCVRLIVFEMPND